MPYKSKEIQNAQSREWYKKNPEKRDIIRNRYIQKLRNFIFEILGDECNKCGFKDKRALQIDHINGGGAAESRKRTRNLYSVVIESLNKNENKYQILCANCNWIKRTENNELKRKKII